jgi:hypothetical protein
MEFSTGKIKRNTSTWLITPGRVSTGNAHRECTVGPWHSILPADRLAPFISDGGCLTIKTDYIIIQSLNFGFTKKQKGAKRKHAAHLP